MSTVDAEFEKELQQEILSYADNSVALARINLDIIKEMLISDGDLKKPTQLTHQEILASKARHYEPKKNIIRQESEEDYEQSEEVEQVKKHTHPPHHQSRVISYDVQKFKQIGRNSKDQPIYRMTDLYLTAKMPVEKLFEEKMSSYINVQRPRRVRESNQESLNQVLDKWINKQNQDFHGQDKDEMGISELEQIVADMGEKKQNFFLYYQDYPQAADKFFDAVPVHYSVLQQPNWGDNFLRQVARNRQKYEMIQEFEEQDTMPDVNMKQQKKHDEFLLKDKERPEYAMALNEVQKKQVYKPSMRLFNVIDDLRGGYGSNLTNMLLKESAYINSQVVENAFLKPIEEMQKIEIDLNNPFFYIHKVHSTMVCKQEETYRQSQQKQTTAQQTVPEKRQDGQKADGASLVSSSKITGNPTLQSFKQVSDGPGINRSQPINETIESLIANKLKNQLTTINHSDVANRLMCTKFKLDPKDFQNFHRYTYQFDKLKEKVQISVVRNKGLKFQNQYLELNIQKQQSYIKFPNVKDLSLCKGDYIIVENIEENPLLISNVGMCSKLTLQVNSKAVLDALQQENFNKADFEDLEKQREEQKPLINKPSITQSCANWCKVISQALGPNGRVYIGDNQSLLIGVPEGIGVAVLESNLSNMAVVRQRTNPRDFVLVRQGLKWHIRKIDYIYTSGVVEPKMEVFSPDSRQINNFLANYFKSCVRKNFLNGSNVEINELRKIFHNINQNGIRKHLKDIGARPDNDNKTFRPPSDDKDATFDVTPQEICQYEKMQSSLYNLQSIGINHLRVPDKMKQVISAFFKRYPQNLERYAIARMINDELHLTSWYLTQSFINAQQGQAKMELEGIGDPTNGHGGYSYIRKPQKERTDKDEQVTEKKQEKKVSGTGADLRKLKTTAVTDMLIERGLKFEEIKNLKRWDRVDLLKKHGSDKYLRQERQNKKKKKESQKKQISTVFNKMLRHLMNPEKSEPTNLKDDEFNRLQYFIERERPAWEIRRSKYLGRNNPEAGAAEAQEQQDQQNE